MKRFAALALVVFITLPFAVFAQPDDVYHDLNEIHDFIFDLQTTYPDLVKVDSIGHSQTDNEPIYLVKVSNNVQVDENKPSALIVGQIHAEEILGIEVALQALYMSVTDGHREFRYRRNNINMYFILTMNPEGLKVVYNTDGDLPYGYDHTYRKNKRITLDDGLFHYQLGRGDDTSGVDLNRNFDLHFYQGDTLLHWIDEAERYDYYRGSEPFSESETQAIRDIIRKIQPMYSMTFHSSRTGNFAEKVFYPWDWSSDEIKMAPDQDILDDTGLNVAQLIPQQDGSGTYTPLRSAGRNGKMHDWMYMDGGWINMQTEIGNRILQPDSITMQGIVVDVLPSVFYLFDRTMGSSEVEGSTGFLQVMVTDQLTGNPLVAEVLLPDYHNGYLKPRLTDSIWGTHRRPLMPGNYDIIVKKHGYKPHTTQVNVGTYGASPLSVALEQEDTGIAYFRAFEGESQEQMEVTYTFIDDYGIETEYSPSDGELDFVDFLGNYDVVVSANGYLDEVYSLDLNEPGQLFISYMDEITSEVTIDFETSFDENWTFEGNFPWTQSHMSKHSGLFSLKSGETDTIQNIPYNGNGYASYQIDIPDETEAMVLSGFVAHELEPDFDFCYVQTRVDEGEWETIDVLNGYSVWREFTYDLRNLCQGENAEIRWHVITDDTDKDRGLFIDDLEFSFGSLDTSADDNTTIPFTWELKEAYPNPFNPTTKITFSVREQAPVSIIIYDVLGRAVSTLVDQSIEAGIHNRILDMNNFASGVYFIRMSSPSFNHTNKIVLLK